MDALVNELGAQCEWVHCELTDPRSVARAATDVLVRGAPDVLLHAAGVVARARLEELTDETWNEQLEVNVSAPFRLTRALLPKMREASRGRVLFVTSISASLGSKAQSAYNASKAAETALMRCLAEELADTELFTAAVAPGAVETDMLRGSPWPARMGAEEVARTLFFLGDLATRAHNGSVVEMFGV
jgi:NAD(P)-dependent dehydrogenase (short-subunit alcohol dehydrogenase family)